MSNRDYISVNKSAYNKLAEEYKQRLTHKGQYEEKADALISLPLKHLTERKECVRVLEIGPGSGEILRAFEDRDCRTTSIDISENIISVARTTSPDTVFINGNVLEINFPRDQFDIIYAGALIHLFPYDDALKLLKTLCTWSKPDGVVFINTTIHHKSEERILEKTDYSGNVSRFRRNWREEEMQEVIINCNFQVLETAYTDEKDRDKKWVGYVLRKLKSDG